MFRPTYYNRTHHIQNWLGKKIEKGLFKLNITYLHILSLMKTITYI